MDLSYKNVCENPYFCKELVQLTHYSETVYPEIQEWFTSSKID